MQTFRTKLSQVETALHEAAVYCGHGYESVSDEAAALVLGAARLAPEQPLSLLDQPFPIEAEPRLEVLSRHLPQLLPAGELQHATRCKCATGTVIHGASSRNQALRYHVRLVTQHEHQRKHKRLNECATCLGQTLQTKS